MGGRNVASVDFGSFGDYDRALSAAQGQMFDGMVLRLRADPSNAPAPGGSSAGAPRPSPVAQDSVNAIAVRPRGRSRSPHGVDGDQRGVGDRSRGRGASPTAHPDRGGGPPPRPEYRSGAGRSRSPVRRREAVAGGRSTSPRGSRTTSSGVVIGGNRSSPRREPRRRFRRSSSRDSPRASPAGRGGFDSGPAGASSSGYNGAHRSGSRSRSPLHQQSNRHPNAPSAGSGAHSLGATSGEFQAARASPPEPPVDDISPASAARLAAITAGDVEAGEVQAIICGHLLADPDTDIYRTDCVVVVHGGRIVDVYRHKYPPVEKLLRELPSGHVFDLQDSFVMPGLIDLHVNATAESLLHEKEALFESSASKVLRGMRACHSLARAGWTTLRCMGAPDPEFPIVDLRAAINAGKHWGPRLLVAGHNLTAASFTSMFASGGAGSGATMDPWNSVVVGGAEGMRAAVRREMQRGCDWVTLVLSAPVKGMPSWSQPSQQDAKASPTAQFCCQFSSEQVSAAVDEARKWHKSVSAVCLDATSVEVAALCGVRTIEHGCFIDDKAIEIINRRNAEGDPCFLVPGFTLLDMSGAPNHEPATELSLVLKNASRACADGFSSLKKAVLQGVPVALGTGYTGWATGATEFLAMQSELDMSSASVIRSATTLAARVLNLEGKLGVIRPGAWADVVAVRKDPLKDLSALKTIAFVMREGTAIVKAPARA